MSDSLPKNIFVNLPDLLRMEALASGFSFQAKKQKVRTVLGGKHASKLRGRGMDFEEVRQYAMGDDIRNIDWKVTARTQKTHSKVFSEEKEKPVLIVVDQSRSMFFGSQIKTKSVVAAELAALAAFRIQKDGDRVGGVVLGDEDVRILYPKRNRKNTLRFLEEIVSQNHELIHQKPGDREQMLATAMGKVKNIVTHDFLVIVISDFIAYSPKVVQYLARLNRHNDVLVAKIFDPMEREIPKEKMIVGDGEKQLSIDGKKAALREKFEAGFEADLADFEAELKHHRIPVMRFNTINPVEEQLKNVLHQA